MPFVGPFTPLVDPYSGRIQRKQGGAPRCPDILPTRARVLVWTRRVQVGPTHARLHPRRLLLEKSYIRIEVEAREAVLVRLLVLL